MVQRGLWPAFEELFDPAEEHALGVLVGRWREMEEEEERRVASKVGSSVAAGWVGVPSMSCPPPSTCLLLSCTAGAEEGKRDIKDPSGQSALQ